MDPELTRAQLFKQENLNFTSNLNVTQIKSNHFFFLVIFAQVMGREKEKLFLNYAFKKKKRKKKSFSISMFTWYQQCCYYQVNDVNPLIISPNSKEVTQEAESRNTDKVSKMRINELIMHKALTREPI